MTQRHCCTYPSIASPHTLSPSHVTITERHNHKTSTYHSTSASEYVTITLLFDHNTSPSHKVAVTITMVFVRRKATSTTSVIQGLWKLNLSGAQMAHKASPCSEGSSAVWTDVRNGEPVWPIGKALGW